jgi:hypothetical protein
VSWDQQFFDPIVLPNGRALVTLEHAGAYITELPKADQQLDEWQTAIECLLLLVKLGGPTMFARIGIMRALNRNVERAFDSSRKDKHWGTPQAGAGSMTKAGKYHGINPDFMKCPSCGQRFDMRDLDRILLHFHDAAIEISRGPEQPPPKGMQ